MTIEEAAFARSASIQAILGTLWRRASSIPAVGSSSRLTSHAEGGTVDGEAACEEDPSEEGLGEAFWATMLREDAPSRFILVESDNLTSVFMSTRLNPRCIAHVLEMVVARLFLLSFYNIRDAIEFYSTTRLLSDTFCCRNDARPLAKFCCPSFVARVAPEVPVVQSALVVTVRGDEDSSSLATEGQIASAIDWSQFLVKALAPCQLSRSTFRDRATGHVAKYFVDLFDVRSLPGVLEHLASAADLPTDVCISWKACTVALVDQLALFDCEEALSLAGPPGAQECEGNQQPHEEAAAEEALQAASIDELCRPLPPVEPYGSGGEERRGEATRSLMVPLGHRSYAIDFSCIGTAEDGGWRGDQRTTCMIKNIPNKYSQQMLIEMIDESHYGAYDFIYLRMDFKNKCNVGYAFINFIHPRSIVSFAERIHGRRWPKFNSDKVCQLTYARIQGKASLLEKFRHSRVMMELPCYRPKVYYTDEERRGREEPFAYAG